MDETKASKYLVSRVAYVEDDRMWIAPNNSNSIIECSLQTENILNIYGVDEPAREYMFSCVVRMGNELFFIPADAENVWSIDLCDRCLTKIDIGLSEQEKIIKYKFGIAAVSDNSLFIIGNGIAAIIKLEIATGKCERILDVNGRNLFDEDRRLHVAYAVCNGVLYAPFYSTNSLLKLNPYNGKAEVIKVAELPEQYYSFACSQGDYLHLYGPNDDEYIIDSKECRLKEVNKLSIIKRNNNRRYAYVYHGDEKSIYIPVVWPSAYVDRRGESSLLELKIDDKELYGFAEGTYTRYEFINKYENKLLIQSRIDGQIYEIQLDKASIRGFYIKANKDDFTEIMRNNIRHSEGIIIRENMTMTAKLFMKAVCE